MALSCCARSWGAETQPGARGGGGETRSAPGRGGAFLSAAEASEAGAGHAATGHRVARNTLFSAIGEGSNVLLFLLGFLAARLLGPLGFGEYGAAFAFVSIFRILPDFGMSYASTLAISRDRSVAARLAGNLLGFQAVLSVVTLAACLTIGRQLFTGTTWLAVVVLSADLVLKSLKSTLRWLLKSFERFAAEALSLVLERAAILGFCLWALMAGHGVVGFVLVFAVVRMLDAAGLYAWLHHRVVGLRPAADVRLWGELLKKGLPFAYAGVMITLFFQVDAVMLEQMRGAREVGWYRAPVSVLEGLTLVPRILGYALIPTMAVFHQSAPTLVTALYRRGCKYLLLAGLPLVAFGVIGSDPFIPFLFGAEYVESVPVAQVLLPAAAFMFLSNFGETTLACIDRWRTIVVVSTAALALNIVLNLLWIPSQGMHGAARATLLTELAYFAMTAAALALYGHRIGWLPLLVRPALAAAVFAVVLGAVPGPLLWRSIAASLAFAAATFVLGVWDAKERDAARALLHGARPDLGRLD